jgi:FAD/FMN-containing dehydrogenase
LANGEVIQTGRLSKRELNRKLGLATFEGEIYRSLDKLLEENGDQLKQDPLLVSKNTAGYDLWDIKHKDGSFDLTPLLVGAQGTLGLTTEVTLSTEPYSPQTTLIAAHFDDSQVAEQAILELRDMTDPPSAVEMIDQNLLNFVDLHNPNLLKDVVPKPFKLLTLLIELDNPNERNQKRQTKKVQKILAKYEVDYQVERDEESQEALWKIRRSAATILAHSEGNNKALPIIEDGVVPADRFGAYLEGIYQIFSKHHLPVAGWGHAGDANLHVQPFLDLAQVGDRQKVFKLMDEYYTLVTSLGGSTSGEHGDGRLRGPYLEALYGPDIYKLFQQTKQIFDPYNILNPGVKIDVSLDSIKPLLRQDYDLRNFYDHLPYS